MRRLQVVGAGEHAEEPAGYLVGWAAPLKAPWSASTVTRTALIFPSRLAASSPRMWKSRAKQVDIRFSDRSSTHFTGRRVIIAAVIAHR
jgi:hypothetical protein